MRCIIAWNLALDENGKPNVGPFPCGGVVTGRSGTREIKRSGQYWAFAHYSRAFRRGATVLPSDAGIKNISHLPAQNPDSAHALVLKNTASTHRKARIYLVTRAVS